MPNWDSPGLSYDTPGLLYDDPAAWPSASTTMAANETIPVTPGVQADDKAAIAACKQILTYAPRKAIYNQAALDASDTALKTAEDLHTQADAALASARDNLVTAQWARHNLVLGMRGEMKTQFGESSNELQAVGLKKKSEYKSPTRAAKPAKP
jgi:hypothetical protein